MAGDALIVVDQVAAAEAAAAEVSVPPGVPRPARPEETGSPPRDQKREAAIKRLARDQKHQIVNGSRSPATLNHAPAAANSRATTSGTPIVAGLATTSNPAPPTRSGTSGFTTSRRAFCGASKTSPAAG